MEGKPLAQEGEEREAPKPSLPKETGQLNPAMARAAELALRRRGVKIAPDVQKQVARAERERAVHSAPKKRLVAAMYLAGASLRQIAIAAEIDRATVHRYAFGELRGKMPERPKALKGGGRQQPLVREERAQNFWDWLTQNAKADQSAEELAIALEEIE